MRKRNKFFVLGGLTIFSLIFALLMTVSVLAYDPGDSINKNIGLHCNSDYVADLNISDGKVLYMYGAYKILSPSGNVIDEKPLTSFSDGQTELYVITSFVAEEIGTYDVAAGIFYAEQVYNEQLGLWETTSSGQCLYNDRFGIATVTYPSPSVDDILAIITQLYETWQTSI